MVEVRKVDLICSQIEQGRNQGLWQCKLAGTSADKTQKLSLGLKTSLWESSGMHVVIKDPKDTEWSTHALLHRLLAVHLPPGCKLQIFVKKAHVAELACHRLLATNPKLGGAPTLSSPTRLWARSARINRPPSFAPWPRVPSSLIRRNSWPNLHVALSLCLAVGFLPPRHWSAHPRGNERCALLPRTTG